MSDFKWEKLQELFHAAQKKRNDEVDHFLQQACGGDKELKAEVLKLLKAADHNSSSFTEQVSKTSQAILTNSNNNTRIGPYKIIKELGRGGMGSVYLAERADDQFEQQVAIKLISGSVKTESIAVRFMAERQILAKLKHPNIALLLDGGTTNSGEPYFAMEYLEGKEFLNFCDDNNLNINQRVELFIDVCQAVSYAHGQLVLHRDIKPSNILVSAEGQVKLLDFGIAKIITPDELNPNVTAQDQMIMTPEYASPEQVLGENMGVASDIYQMGLVLYQLLTGQQAQEITSVAEVKSKVVDEEPLSPSERISQTDKQKNQSSVQIASDRNTHPASLVKKLTGDLDTIVLKCLHKDPAQRYQGVNELKDDLKAFLEFRPIKARKLSLRYRLNRYFRRHWMVVSTTAVAVAALLGGLSFALVSLEKTKQAEQRAATEAETANQVSQFLIDMITEADPRESGGDEITVKQVLEKSAEKIADLNNQPIIQIRLLQNIGNAFTGIGSLEESQKLLERSLNLVEKIKPPRHDLLISSLGLLSDAHIAQGNSKESLKLTSRAMDIARKHGLVSSNILIQHQESLGANDQFDAAILTAEEALKILDTEKSENSIKSRIQLLAQLARLVETNGNFELSEKYIKEGLNLIQNKPAFQNKKLMLLISLGTIYTQKERYYEAEQLMHEALLISKRVFGEIHVENIRVYLLLGRNQLRQFKISEANSVIRAGMSTAEKTVGQSHPAYIQLLEILANIKQVEGNYLESLSTLKESTQIASNKMGEKHGMTLVSTGHQIPLLLFIGRLPEAERKMDQLFTNFSEMVPPDHPFMIWVYGLSAEVSLETGNLVKSDEMAKKLLASKDNRMVLKGLNSLIKKAILSGELQTAKTHLTAIENTLKQYENSNQHQADYLYFFAEYLLYMGKHQEGQQKIDNAIQAIKEYYPENHPLVLSFNLLKAKYLSISNHHDDAIRLATDSYLKWLQWFDKNENKSAMMAATLASIYLKSGQPDKAEALITHSMNTLQNSLGPEHFEALRSSCLMGKIQIAKGQNLEGSLTVKQSLNGLISQLGNNSPLVKSCESELN